MKIKMFSNAEALTINSISNLGINEGLDMNTYKIAVMIVKESLNQLEESPELKKLNIKLN